MRSAIIATVRCLWAPREAATYVERSELAGFYGMPRPQVAGRPWVGICMIASLDGATAVDGRSGGLGSADDRAVLATLRDAADVILVGAGTAATENYQPPARPGQRIGVVTASGDVDTTNALFASGAGFLVMPVDGPPQPAGVDALHAGRGRVDLAAAIARIGEQVAGVRFVQVEGGPRLNGSLLAAGLVDEINLSVAPLAVGGSSDRLAVGAAERRDEFDLAHVLAGDDGYLFTRWVRRR